MNIIGSIKAARKKMFLQYPADLIQRQVGMGSVLDLGCGSDTLIRFDSFSVGVDLNAQSLEESRGKGKHSAYILADVNKLPFRPKSFDTVMAVQVIEHLTKEDGYKFIEDILKIARKKVVIATPNGYLPEKDLETSLQDHRSGWSAEDFGGYGFKVFGAGGSKVSVLSKVINENSSLHHRIAQRFFPLALIQDILQKVTYRYPKHAAHLIAVLED